MSLIVGMVVPLPRVVTWGARILGPKVLHHIIRKNHVLLSTLLRPNHHPIYCHVLHGYILTDARWSGGKWVALQAAIRASIALHRQRLVALRGWTIHGVHAVHAVIALNPGKGERVQCGTTHRIAGTTWKVGGYFMGHHTPRAISNITASPRHSSRGGLMELVRQAFLGVTIESHAGPQAHPIHVRQRSGWSSTSGSSILGLKSIMLSWCQTEEAWETSSTDTSTLASLAGAARQISGDRVIGISRTDVVMAVATKLGRLTGAAAGIAGGNAGGAPTHGVR